MKVLNWFYWSCFALTIIILALNVGLVLFGLGLLILPVFVLHADNGQKIRNLRGYDGLIIFSSLNLLLFALMKPDGTHTISENGLSRVLGFFGVNAGFYDNYKNWYFIACFFLLVFQFIAELRLRNQINKPTRKS